MLQDNHDNGEEKDINESNQIIGVDCGTTFSACCMVINNQYQRPTSIEDSSNNRLIPSIIYVDKNYNVIIGDEAKNLLKVPKKVPHIFFDTKRTIGVPLSFIFYSVISVFHVVCFLFFMF